MTSDGNNFNHFAENQLIKLNARDAGDFSDAAGEREMAPKCGSLPRDAGDLVGLCLLVGGFHYVGDTVAHAFVFFAYRPAYLKLIQVRLGCVPKGETLGIAAAG